MLPILGFEVFQSEFIWGTMGRMKSYCKTLPEPSDNPSSTPSNIPSDVPSNVPSDGPSNIPSLKPSMIPILSPSTIPSSNPSHEPSDEPTQFPSRLPSDSPSADPSKSPSVYPIVEVSYNFPSTKTNQFVHGLCVLGSTNIEATSSFSNLEYILRFKVLEKVQNYGITGAI